MTIIVFLVALAAIAGLVLVIEADGEESVRLRHPIGLLTWLTRGNWPAKVGGALVIVGLAALLRYALINIDVPATLKLAAGVVTSLALGLASMLVGGGSARRAVSLALGGAAFGVAYMTAYSAFALFHYVADPIGLAFLALTSVGAGVFAVTRSALSLAVLSMVGAFMAPAFAVGDPGPQVVYGYYLAASLLTLAMVRARGWRPLIHLSFLFTIAGGVFFAWTAKYYTAEYSDVMRPMLLLLSAVHVAMPIVERSRSPSRLIERLDVLYMIALPVVAAVVAVGISPNRLDLSTTLFGLGGIWVAAAACLRVARREGALTHAVIGALLILLGAASRFHDWPWELISLALAVGALGIAGKHSTSRRLHNILAGLVVLLGAMHVLSSHAGPAHGQAFLSGPFLERIVGATLFVIAGWICRRLRQSLDTLLLAVGICWGAFAIGSELIRWNLATLAVVVHWALLLTAASLCIAARRVRIADSAVVPLVVAIVATAAWSSMSASAAAAWISLLAASLVLIAVSVRPDGGRDDSSVGRLVAALGAAVVGAVWGSRAGSAVGIELTQFALLCGSLAAIGTLVAGRMATDGRADWLGTVADVFGVAFTVVITCATLLFIARDPWAVSLEVACLGGLGLVAWIRARSQRPVDSATAACILAFALILQASVLRWLGPPGDLTVADILRMRSPAVVSLVWATAGSALTILSLRVASRRLWAGGAALLVASAIKFVLIDFGSLGQLANILAVIAAGGMFLLVGWLAPIPPASRDDETPPATDFKGSGTPATSAVADRAPTRRGLAWSIALIVGLASAIQQCGHDVRDPRIPIRGPQISAEDPAPPT